MEQLEDRCVLATPIGEFDSMEPGWRVEGWAYDPDTPNQSIQVQFCIARWNEQSTCIETRTANVSRPGLPVSGNHGFRWPIPDEYLDYRSANQPHTLRVWAIDSGNGSRHILGDFPMDFANRAPVGYFDKIDYPSYVVRGWAIDPDDSEKHSSIDVQICIDGDCAETNAIVTTSEYRDINGLFNATGNHGFSWQIPPRYRDNQPHIVRVWAFDSALSAANQIANKVSLDNSPWNFTTAPQGYFDGINSSWVASGWALDSDFPNDSVLVQFCIDGNCVAQPTSLPRNDINYVFGQIQGNHGFQWQIPTQYLADGVQRELRIWAVDPADGTYREPLGNSPQTFQNRRPGGSLEGITQDTFAVFGWAGDPDVPEQQVEVHFFIDGQMAGATVASQPRQIPGYTGDHGFSWQIPLQYLDGNPHTIGATAIDQFGVIGGELFRFVTTFGFENQNPVGRLEQVSADTFTVTGWAADPDIPSTPITVSFFVDGQPVTDVVADRPHAGSGFPGNHGFSWQIPAQYLDGNTHTIGAVGIDQFGQIGGELLLLQTKFRNQLPVGALERVDVTGSALYGWATDPDIHSPTSVSVRSIDVRVHIDGQFVGTTTASQPLNTGQPQGFEFPIPLQYLDGNVHLYEVYGVDASGLRTQLLDSAYSAPVVPEIEISVDSVAVVNGQTAAINIGQAGQGGERPSQRIQVKNMGGGVLRLGYPIVSSPHFVAYLDQNQTALTAESSIKIVVLLRTNVQGHFRSTLTLSNNDANEGSFTFPIEGTISGLATPPPLVGYASFAAGGSGPSHEGGTLAYAASDVLRIQADGSSFTLEKTLDGPSIGLTESGENIDALAVTGKVTDEVTGKVTDESLYFSIAGSGDVVINGIRTPLEPGDIFLYNPETIWGDNGSVVFSANSHGVVGANIDAFEILSGGRYGISFAGTVTVPNLGPINDEDVVIWDGRTQSWAMFLDGSANGLDQPGEGISNFAGVAPFGSDTGFTYGTYGAYSVPGVSGTANEMLTALISRESAVTWVGKSTGPIAAAIGSRMIDAWASPLPIAPTVTIVRAPEPGVNTVLSTLEDQFEVYIPGDYDRTLSVSHEDIDRLSRSIAESTLLLNSDLNSDGVTNSSDLSYLLNTILGTDYGDTNLDQRVDRADLSTIVSGFGRSSGSQWSDGDFDGDGLVGLRDLWRLQGSYRFGTPSPAPSVAAAIVAHASRSSVMVIPRMGLPRRTESTLANPVSTRPSSAPNAAAADRVFSETPSVLRATRRRIDRSPQVATRHDDHAGVSPARLEE